MIHRVAAGMPDMLDYEGVKFFGGRAARIEQPHNLISTVTYKMMLLFEFLRRTMVRLKPIGEI
jgi:hypothetical protein